MHNLTFLDDTVDMAMVLSGHYSPGLVLLSYLPAAFAAYAALRLADRIIDAEIPRLRYIWMAIGAIVMGIGIWATHFIGMLAYKMSMPAYYDPVITLVSILPAILVSAVTLHVISRHDINFRVLVIGGVIMGGGISIMHYSGMGAMRMNAIILYHPGMFALSIMVAVVLATLALYVKFVTSKQTNHDTLLNKAGSALLMGFAVTSMHYTAMTAAYFFPAGSINNMEAGLSPVWLGVLISVGSILIISLVIAATIVDYQITARKRLDVEIHKRIEAEAALMQDIADRKLAEDAADNSKRVLQVIMDNSPAVIYMKDEEGRYTFINRKWKQLFDKQNKGIIGKTDHEIFPKDLADGFTINDKAVLTLGHTVETEEVAPHDDGLHNYISIKFPLLNEKGKTYAVCGISTDITERKKLEKQLVQSQKMEAIGHLAGGIAHDFNNILASILGYSELSSRAAKELGDKKLEKYLGAIIKGINRAAKLIEEMLIFSRAETEMAKVIHVNDIVKDTLSLLKGSLPSSVEVKIDLGTEILPIRIDPIQLEQVLINLCVNAMHAMNGIGALTIGARRLTITENNAETHGIQRAHNWDRVDICFCENRGMPSHAGDYIEITVRDTGSGIAKEHLEHIFEPFYTTKSVGKGTGMGLAMTHGIIKGANGHIIVETQHGTGTLFRILFKACESAATDKSAMDIEHVTTTLNGAGYILLVDDEVDILDYKEEFLTSHGYQIKRCGDGEAALAMFMESPEKFDMVITDQTMPKMTGVELSKIILQSKPDMPIILCTGYSELVNEAQAMAIGIRAYLKKPTDQNLLLQTISETLSGAA